MPNTEPSLSSLRVALPWYIQSSTLPAHLLHFLLQVVYSQLEPLVHKYVKDLRPPQNGYSGTIQKWQDLVVLVRLMTKEHAEVRRRCVKLLDASCLVCDEVLLCAFDCLSFVLVVVAYVLGCIWSKDLSSSGTALVMACLRYRVNTYDACGSSSR